MGAVKYLLDTHTFLWAVRESPKLSNNAKTIIADKDAEKFVSAVCAYEVMYKYKIGKLYGFEDVAENYFNMSQAFGATELPLTAQHAHLAGKFDWEHRDPFDRMYAAQASAENMILLTNDPAFKELPWVTLYW
ncbi:MAG: type II toxin-antitoxin system VapC family toxin [Oscillospiraceae bacterium]|nr:type II toxin-antitoxin system VapC family toxin [Oscillospiraceae bacterium]